MTMTRREALKLLGAAGLSVAGCAEDRDETSESDDALNPFRCGNTVDRAVGQSVDAAPPELRKYEKIVVLMMENRSFDHYFGHLSMPKSLGGEGRTDVDGLRGDEVQFLDRGQGREQFRLFHAGSDYTLGDIAHEWDDCHGQFNAGAMDGFIEMHVRELDRVARGQAKCGGSTFHEKCARLGDAMAYYKRQDTPVLHQLFDHYALCDRWFSSVMGPTWPNRFYLHAATSCGIKENSRMDIAKVPTGPRQARTLWHELDSRCISAVNYSVDVPWNMGGFGVNVRVLGNPVFSRSRAEAPPILTWSNASFEEACAMGILPTVSIIDPAFILSPCDDHPPHDVKAGQAFIAAIYKMLTSNEEQWSKTLFIITYDEHGSFYDHVTPPKVLEDERPEFQQLGFRVPSLVIGPYVKKNYVSHAQYDHVSFLSTVTRRFGLTPLNRRVATANDVRDCIDRNLVETDRLPASPVKLQTVALSESRVHESIRFSLGQSELADIRFGGPATLEQKRRGTDELLTALDRLGVAQIGR